MDRVLVFVAHPDDETIGCSGLLQRASTSLVVFAVDGAPPHYGFERRFGSLRKYSETRFLEASRALSLIPRCSFQRLRRPDGSYFVDQHLFQDLRRAYSSLLKIAGEFSPTVIVSHTYEGGHIDHDACSFLAMKTSRALAIQHWEFPLYRKSELGQDIFQEFRDCREAECVLALSEDEMAVKQRMRAEYRTQREMLRVFVLDTERFRRIIFEDYTRHQWSDYAFENRPNRLNKESFFRSVAEFEGTPSLPGRTSSKKMWVPEILARQFHKFWSDER